MTPGSLVKSLATWERLANKTTLHKLMTAVPMRTATCTVTHAVQGRPAPAKGAHGHACHDAVQGQPDAHIHALPRCAGAGLLTKVVADARAGRAAKPVGSKETEGVDVEGDSHRGHCLLGVWQESGQHDNDLKSPPVQAFEGAGGGGKQTRVFPHGAVELSPPLTTNVTSNAHIMTMDGTARCMYSGQPLHASQLKPRHVRCELSCRRVYQTQ